jgi:hypothetical protein
MDAAVAELREKGVEIEREPFEARTFWGRQLSVTDPNGWGISLREWRAPDGPEYPDWQPNSEGVTRTG